MLGGLGHATTSCINYATARAHTSVISSQVHRSIIHVLACHEQRDHSRGRCTVARNLSNPRHVLFCVHSVAGVTTAGQHLQVNDEQLWNFKCCSGCTPQTASSGARCAVSCRRRASRAVSQSTHAPTSCRAGRPHSLTGSSVLDRPVGLVVTCTCMHRRESLKYFARHMHSSTSPFGWTCPERVTWWAP